MNRKDFFKSIFGGVVAAAIAPSLLKAEEKPHISLTSNYKTVFLNPEGNLGLGTSYPNFKLDVADTINN
jgi:hypothetical protein